MGSESPSLGHLLLRRAKHADCLPPDDLDGIDCIQLQCLRSEGATRAAHRCVLETTSNFFARALAKLRAFRQTRNGSWSNVLPLDISGPALDLILWHVYTGESIQADSRMALEVFCAAKQFGLHEIEQQMVELLRPTIEAFLKDDILREIVRSPASIDLIISISKGSRFDIPHRNLREQCLTSRSTEGIPQSKPDQGVGQSRQMLLDPQSQGQSIKARKTTAAVIGHPADLNWDSWRYVIVSLASETTIWSIEVPSLVPVYPMHLRDIRPYSGSFVFNDRLYTPWLTAVQIRDLSSNLLVEEIRVSDGDEVIGTNVFQDEVFFHTANAIYIFDPLAANCVKFAELELDAIGNQLTVLKRDSDGFTFAVHILPINEVWAFRHDRGCTTAASRVRLRTVSGCTQLIGSHSGLLYYCIATGGGPPCYYAAFSGDVEMKRYQLANCVITCPIRIYDGVLYYFARGSTEQASSGEASGSDVIVVRGIDLNTDTVCVERPLAELGLERVFEIIPVLAEPQRKPM